MSWLAARCAGDRVASWLADALVLAGLVGFVAAGVRRGGARRRRAHRPHRVARRGPLRARHRRRRPGVRARCRPGWSALASRVGARRPALAVRRAAAVLRDGDRQLRRRRSCPTRMARVLAEGTGAEWAQVWLVVGDRPTLAATWPPDADPASRAGRRDPAARTTPAGPALAAGAPRRRAARRARGPGARATRRSPRSRSGCSPGSPTRPGWCCAAPGCAPSSSARLAELSARAEELRASRERLVDAQDAERRRLERDIHDGAQQHLVALAVNLRLAETLAARVARSAPTRCSPRRSRPPPRPSTTLVAACPAASTRGCWRTDGLAPRSRGGRRPARCPVDGRSPRGVGRYSADRRGGGVLLLPGGACRTPPSTRARRDDPGRPATEPDAGLRSRSRTTASGFDPATAAAGTGLANMRDRVESRRRHAARRSRAGRGTRVRRRAARAAGRRRRTGGLTCAPASPGLLAGAHRSCSWSPTSSSPRSTGRCSPRTAVAVHGFPFVDGAVLGCAVHGCADRLPLRAAPDRLAARPWSASPAPSPCSPRPTASG